MKNVQRRREELLNENITRKKHNSSRQSMKTQSTNNQQMFTPLSSLNTTYDEGQNFHVRDKK